MCTFGIQTHHIRDIVAHSKNTMLNFPSILLSVLSLYSYSTECEKLKHEKVYHIETSITSANTNELINKLTVCGVDNYDIALISNPEFFMQIIDELTSVNNDDITIEDLTNYLNNFKKTQFESYEVHHAEIKQFVDYYYAELTTKNLEGLITDYAENNGKEIASELKNYAIEKGLIDSEHSLKFVLNNFYLNKYDVGAFDDNLNSMSWQTNNFKDLDLGKEIDKKYYEDRIKISSSKNESHLIIRIALAEDWNIYTIEKETTNIFRTTIVSRYNCINTSEIKVSNEKFVPDPMGMNGELKIISGTSTIEIPIEENCTGPFHLEFTFTLVKNDGSSIPFIKEIIEIK